MTKLSAYPNSVTERPKGVDLLDFTTIAAGLKSRKMLYSILERDIGVQAESALDIDLNVETDTPLPFNSSGKKIIFTQLIMINTSSGKGLDPEISIGTNNPDYNNIVPALVLTGFHTSGQVWIWNIEGLLPSPILTDSDTVVFLVRNAGGGAQPTKVYLLGTSEDV